MNSKQTRVSLEDLLRVKRAEQPSVTFWADFEREMRTKQLAAIVEPRPWWAPFIKIGSRVSHYNLPIGAAAVLALSFISLTEYRSVPVRGVSHLEPLATVTAPAPAPDAVAPRAETQQLAVATPAEYAAEELPTVVEQVARTIPRSHTEPLVEPDRIALEPTPSARYIAANLAAAREADPRIVDEVFGPSVRSVEARQPVRDPLTQMAAPSESRRTRLLESALPAVAGSGDVAVGTSDRVARRLTDERLYDTIRRVGLQGDRVAFKF